MPELAEVETVRLQIEKVLKGHKIKEVLADREDRWLFAFAPLEQVKKSLIGAKVMGTDRRGKYFWLKLNRKPWPIIHLGMSGNVSLLRKKQKSHQKIWGGNELQSSAREAEDRQLWFSRMLLVFEGGLEMAIIDPRRFGRLWLTDNPLEHPRIKKLGYDPLIDFPTAKELGVKLKKRNKAIKSVMLDQNLFAGIGNWLADEILYQARLSPHHKASKLTVTQIKGLRTATLSVVRKAVSVDADYEKFPKTWLFHHRWGKSKTAKTSKGKIIHEEVGGRTTAWVPDWQK